MPRRRVFAGAKCIATLRSLDLLLTVPGGTEIGVEGITNVSVVSAFRRRGLLRQLMRTTLDDAIPREHPVAALVAAEYWIYGRYGFGPATRVTSWEVDVRRAGQIHFPGAAAGRVEALSLEEVRNYGPAVHERFRSMLPGAINRTVTSWRTRTGELRSPYSAGWAEPMAVMCRDDDGEPSGMALYHADGSWRGGDPDMTLTVDDLLAAHPAASATLWQHLLTMDWVPRLTAARVAPDDPLPLLLDNPRAVSHAAGTGHDHLWLRVLDVPRTLAARRYDVPGRLVLDVTDRLGYAAGRFAIEADADGHSSASATSEPADLAIDVPALAILYLGDRTAHQLAPAGALTGLRSGAVTRADQMFRTSAAPAMVPRWLLAMLIDDQHLV